MKIKQNELTKYTELSDWAGAGSGTARTGRTEDQASHLGL